MGDEAPHETSLTLYGQLIKDAITSVAEAEFLTDTEKVRLTSSRLHAMTRLSLAAQKSLTKVHKADIERGIDMLESAQATIESLIGSGLRAYPDEVGQDIIDQAQQTLSS